MARAGRPLVVIATLVLAACSSSGKSAADPPPSPSSLATPKASRVSTTTTTVGEYSFDDTATPPALVNTGTDYTRIALSLLTCNDWLLAHHPDQALMRRAVAQGSSVERATSHDIGVLLRTNRRLYETINRPDRITVISSSQSAVSLRDVQYLTKESVVDGTGRVVSEVQRKPTTYMVLIVRQQDNRWYLAAVDKTAEAP